jgi:uncharacterized repeat protein (TIGR03943 family)
VSRRGQAVALFLLGLAVLQASLTNAYLSFVKPGMRPLLIGAGLLLFATAAATLWYEREGARGVDRSDGDHGHAHANPRVAWLLLLPVAVLAVVAPSGLGADAARRSGSAVPPAASDFDPLPDGDPVSISLPEYASRAVFDQGQSLQGRTIRLVGFVMFGDDGRPYLARIIVTCCAADGRPIKVGITGKVPAGLTADSWLEVTGHYTSETGEDPVNGAVIAFIEVSDAGPVAQPASPYQY